MLHRPPTHNTSIVEGICKTVETIQYFAQTSEDRKQNFQALMSLKVITDTEITIDLLMETIMLPLVSLCVEKQLSSQQGVRLCTTLMRELGEGAQDGEIACRQSILTTLDVVVKKLKVGQYYGQEDSKIIEKRNQNILEDVIQIWYQTLKDHENDFMLVAFSRKLYLRILSKAFFMKLDREVFMLLSFPISVLG